jgi:hypothetical protein
MASMKLQWFEWSHDGPLPRELELVTESLTFEFGKTRWIITPYRPESFFRQLFHLIRVAWKMRAR